MNLTLANFGHEDFAFWVHYVDDVLEDVDCDFDVDKFLDYLNSFDPKIQFTADVQQDDKFSFLDIKIIVNSDGVIDTTVFRKKTHTNLHTFYSSFSDI
jgi:hypothetical protein